MKVLHIADVHLTSRADRSAREAERVDRLLERLSQAVSEGVELLLIAGDLFDSPFESESMTRRVFTALAELGIPVCIIAGNHDCACIGSVYTHTELPENLHLLQGDVFETDTYAVYGTSYTSRYETRRVLADFTVGDPDKINILLHHGDLVTAGVESEYAPFTLAQLAESGADYVALGHIHKRINPDKAGRTTYAYAGIPDGRGFDEEGEQGGWMLDLQKGKVTATFYPMSGRRYLEQTVDLSGLTHTAACAEKILKELSGTYDDAYKIHLTGQVLFPLSVKALCEALSELYFVKCIDECGQETDLTEGFDDYSLVGLFHQSAMDKINAATDEETRRMLELARSVGLAALLEQPLRGVDEE